MEVAKIDWEDSKFEKDDIYEHINAPQWIDFHSPDDNDDVAWFCRPDCNHPKSVDDFFKQRTPQSKLLRSATVSEALPLGDRNRREAALKKRGIPQPPAIWSGKDFNEDGENENPNMSTTPLNQKSRLIKESIKSSADKKNLVDIPLNKEEESTTPKLKSTLSARNLFAGKDILNQITEFCTELKKLATRAKEKEKNVEKENTSTKKSPLKKEADDDSRVLRERESEIKPLLEATKEKCEETEKSSFKEKLRRKKRNDEAENTPPTVSLNMKNMRHKREESLLQIRTNPPSPQCFSANRAPIKATPPKAFRPKPPQERGVFQELKESNKEVKKEESVGKSGNNGSLVAEREGRTLDVFWFLKPCTLSS